MLYGLPHIIFPFAFHLFFPWNCSTLFCVTVKQGPCNTFFYCFFIIITLLLPFESLIINSPSYVVWTVTLFSHFIYGTVWILYIFRSLSKWKYDAFFCVNFRQILCNVPPLPLNGQSVELFFCSICACSTRLNFFLLGSFLTHSYFYAVWNGNHRIFLHSLSGNST